MKGYFFNVMYTYINKTVVNCSNIQCKYIVEAETKVKKNILHLQK